MDRDDFDEADDLCTILLCTILIITSIIWIPYSIGYGIYIGFKKLFRRSCDDENPEKA